MNRLDLVERVDEVVFVKDSEVAPIMRLEQDLVSRGVPQRAMSGAIEPIRNEVLEVYPLVIHTHAMLGKGFVKELKINSMCGVFADVTFEMERHADPRIVIPLFITSDRLVGLYSALMGNMAAWHPQLRNLDEFSREMNQQFAGIGRELAPFVRREWFEWFWRKMAVYIGQPRTWWGKPMSTTLRPQQKYQQMRDSRRNNRADLVAKFQKRFPDSHHTAWETMANEVIYGGGG